MNQDYLYQNLYRWWEQNKRILPWRETTDGYRIWLSEIILQQTRVDQGLPYYLRFVEHYPTVRDLALADEEEVMRLWQGLGYYSRARNLMAAARMIYEAGCKMQDAGDGSFPSTWEELRQLPGVGDYTAGAIASFAYNLPYPALDGNVYRVLSRLYDCDIPFDTTAGKKHFRSLAEQLLDRTNPRLFNSAIMEFGALYCSPQNPDCAACPLSACCLGYQHGTAGMLPVRKPRPKVTERRMHYVIYLDRDRRTLIHKRSGNDIWKGLWEFVAGEAPEQKAAQHIALTHILSHRKLLVTFDLKLVESLPDIPDTKAVRWDELDDYGMPKLMLNAIAQLPIINHQSSINNDSLSQL